MVNKKTTPYINSILNFYGDDVKSAIEIVELTLLQIPIVETDLLNASTKLNNDDLVAKLHYHGPSFTYAGLEYISVLISNTEQYYINNIIKDADDSIILNVISEIKNCSSILTEILTELKEI